MKYYHIFNRGNNKQNIFFSDEDRYRFLFNILFYQSPISHLQISRKVQKLNKGGIKAFSVHDIERIVSLRCVGLVSFAFMLNHFHLLIKAEKDEQISQYLQRVKNSYTKYINIKYKKVGHLFQGRYKKVAIASENDLLRVSAYIHLNPRELEGMAGREKEYYWSSLQDITDRNRWGDLLLIHDLNQLIAKGSSYFDLVMHSNVSKLADLLD